MNIVIIGATGGVGRLLVERTLEEGHQVTAAVRNPVALTMIHDRLRIVTCDVRDQASVDRAVAGHDAVFCTLGEPSRGPTTLYSTGARNVVRAMRANSVPRVVFLSNFGILDETAADMAGALLLFMVRRFIRHTLDDHRRALDEIRAQAAEWVVVRPLALTNGPRTGQYRVAVEGLPPKGTKIARADVADFMLRQATATEYLNQAPALAY